MFDKRANLAAAEHHAVVDTDKVVTFKVDLLSPRARRGLSVIVVAVTVTVVSSVVYLHPSPPPKAAAPLPTPSPLPLSRLEDDVSYDFMTSSMGWALVATTGAGRTQQFSVFRTVDGAKHWVKQLTGSQDVFDAFALPSMVKFFDRSNGFVQIPGLNDIVYRTTDGGAHWRSVVLPSPGGAVISFSDPSNGWVLVSASPTDQKVNLYATIDGGSTWQRLPDPPRDVCVRAFGSCELAIGLGPAVDRQTTISFRGPSEGWLGGRGDPEPHVYSSSDGGRSWNRHNVPVPKDGPGPRAISSVHLLPGAGVIAYLDGGSGPDYPVTSFDGGASWRSVTTPPTYGNNFGGGSISYQDAYHWWNTDGNNLFKSSDAGETWSVSNLGIIGLFSYQFIDSQHVWGRYLGTATRQGLAVTADGGLHWTQASVPDPA